MEHKYKFGPPKGGWPNFNKKGQIVSVEKSIATIIAWQENYGEKIDDIYLILHGNGNPSQGFIHRLLDLERLAAFGTRVGWLSGGAIVTGLIAYGLSVVL